MGKGGELLKTGKRLRKILVCVLAAALLFSAGISLVPADTPVEQGAGQPETMQADQNLPEEQAADAMDAYTLKDTVSPKGTTIHLFDYWISDNWYDPDNEPTTDFSKGINQGHQLRFGRGMDISKYKDIGLINVWTKGIDPMAGFVQNRLDENGYPKLISGTYKGNVDGTSYTQELKDESLGYLFDSSTHAGKAVFENVRGLLRVDQNGYYYYNSNHNYAYYDREQGDGGTFQIYNTWGVKKVGGNSEHGQFFPFTSPGDVFEQNVDGLTQKDINTQNEILNHYFGLMMSTRFIQQENGKTKEGEVVTYEFGGDDDVWVFIDDVLVADLGGNHDPATLKIDFSTGKITVNGKDNGTLKAKFEAAGQEGADNRWNENTFADNTYHTLDFFYLERGNTDSNMSLKFNLVSVPESSIVKTDQVGHSVPGAEFELYQANASYEIAKDSGGREKLLASGTTGADGEFVLLDNDGFILSLNDLYQEGVQYLVLRETKVPEGYRSPGDIHFYLAGNKDGNKGDKKYKYTVLLSDNHWETGAYALPKVTVTSEEKVTAIDNSEKAFDLSENKNKMFAVVKKKRQGGDQSIEWLPVSGSAESGWRVADREEMEAVLSAARENPYVFTLDASGSYKTEIINLPGDITKYYRMQQDIEDDTNESVEYKIYYYVTTGGSLEQATSANTYLVGSATTSGFDREFSTRLNVPNIENRLYVQKTDEANHPVNGAKFALYRANNSCVHEDATTGKVTIQDPGVNSMPAYSQADYKEITTGKLVLGPTQEGGTGTEENSTVIQGAAVFEKLKIDTKNGEQIPTVYYLVETSAPDGYVKSDQVTKIVVDRTGVYADAGEKNDGITVSRGVGALVNSMIQFAPDDDIDATLFNIKATLQTTEQYPLQSGNQWETSKTDGADDVRHLHYVGTNPFLVYEPFSDDEIPGFNQIDEGWPKLLIQQCTDKTHDPDKESPIQNLGETDLTNLYSGIVMVHVENQRMVEVDLNGKKTLLGDRRKTEYTFDFQLFPGDEKTAEAIQKGDIVIPGLNQLEKVSTDTCVKTATAKIPSASGNVSEFSFEEIQVKATGIYSFVIREEIPKSPDDRISYDEHSATVTITVSESKTADDLQNVKKFVAEVSYTNQQAVTDTDAGAADRAAFTNNIKADFSFTKTDETGSPLKDAAFGLYQLTCTDSGHNHLKQLIQVDKKGELSADDKTCWTQVKSGVVSNEKGTVVFSGLLPSTGQYRLVEYKAPGGYILPKGQWNITWDPDHSAFIFGENCGIENPPAVDGDPTEGYSIKNYQLQDLPTTGDTGIRAFLAAGLCLMSAGAVSVLVYLKKRKQHSV